MPRSESVLWSRLQELEGFLGQSPSRLDPTDDLRLEFEQRLLGVGLTVPAELSTWWDWCGGTDRPLVVPGIRAQLSFYGFETARSSELQAELDCPRGSAGPLNMVVIGYDLGFVYAEIDPGSDDCRIWTRHPEDDRVSPIIPSLSDFAKVLLDLARTDVGTKDDPEVLTWDSPTLLAGYFPDLFENDRPKTRHSFWADLSVGFHSWPAHWRSAGSAELLASTDAESAPRSEEMSVQLGRFELLLDNGSELVGADPQQLSGFQQGIYPIVIPSELRQFWDWGGGLTEPLESQIENGSLTLLGIEQSAAIQTDLVAEGSRQFVPPMNLVAIFQGDVVVFAEIDQSAASCRVWVRRNQSKRVELICPSITDFARLLADLPGQTEVGSTPSDQATAWHSPAILSRHFPELFDGEVPKTTYGLFYDVLIASSDWPSTWIPQITG